MSLAKLPRRLQAQFERNRAELLKTDIALQGSVTQRWMPCGKKGCRCQADPPQLHGPYYQWTFKRKGKTVTVNLTASQAKTYQRAIDNHRKMEKILDQMRTLSLKTLEAETNGVKKRKSPK